jgi:hypothetical protein
MTGSTRRAAAVIAALAGALLALGLGVATAGPAAGVQLPAPHAAGAWAEVDSPSVVTTVQTVVDRETVRVVTAVRTVVQPLRGWSTAAFEVLAAALLLLWVAARCRFAPSAESVPQRVGGPRSPPGSIRS